tara:strand:- start:374 stop:1750 length:1377 start_codon:yes stop_codon:yes gene_type:complete
MRHNKKAFTLIEMLVAMSVSAIIVAATYASFELIQKQYKKNVDIVELHTSGRAIMQVIEREIRMAGYEFRDVNGLMTYGSILSPIVIIDSGDKCCDEVTIIYDEVADFLNSSGVVTSSTVDRIQIRFWTEAHSSSNKGSRFRLYKRRTVLGTNNALLATPNIGPKEVMADFIEDIQFDNTSGFANLYASDYEKLHIYDTISKKYVRTISLPFTPYSTGSISIDRNGSVYIPVGKNGRTSILIINPKSGAISYIDPPGSNNRFNPYVGIASDGNLYIESSGGADVYDTTTKQLIKSITPDKTIKNLLANEVASNSVGVICKPPLSKTWIDCSNSAQLASSSIGYSTLTFGTDSVLYGGNNKASNQPIDIFNTSTSLKIGEILVGSGAQNANSRTYGLISASTIKTLATVDISLVLRTRGKYGKNRQVDKKDYHAGNFNFTKNDQYFRDIFSSTVSVRNL